MVSISSFMYLNTSRKGMKYLVDRSDQHPMLAKLPLGKADATHVASAQAPYTPAQGESGPQNVPGYAPPSSKMFWPVR